MPDQQLPSQDLADLFFLAMERAFTSTEDGGRALSPFTVTVSLGGGEPQVTDFAQDDGLTLARRSVADAAAGLRLYAIAGEGFIKHEGRRWDAILVEAGEAGQDHAFLFALRRQHPAGEQRWEPDGGAELIARPLCLLAATPAPEPTPGTPPEPGTTTPAQE